MSFKLLIVDDNCVMRRQIKSFLSARPDIEIIGEAEDGEAAILLTRKLSPDIVLMDINMPKLSGIESATEILRNNALVKIIILSTHFEKQFVKTALKAGVSGYVLKTFINQDLMPAIDSVIANKLFVSPQIKGVVIEDYEKPPPKSDDSCSGKNKK
jgi:DNA-binding NarL/FixJ family response regulator